MRRIQRIIIPVEGSIENGISVRENERMDQPCCPQFHYVDYNSESEIVLRKMRFVTRNMYFRGFSAEKLQPYARQVVLF